MMKMKKIIVILTLISVFVLSFGFGASAEPFRVAFIMPSAINDFAWSQSMYEALLTIQEEMGKENFEFVYSENMFIVADAAAAIRDYASEGYNLVIAHGSQYGASLTDIAPDFPDTSFAWGSTANVFTDLGITNIFAYEPLSEQGGYVNGVLAAKLSKSNIYGVIGPIETGDAKRYTEGFKAGIKSVKPDAKINVTWIGSYSDVALASEAAQAHIDAGADVLTGTSQMTVGAIGVAKQRGALWFGYDVDQSALAPQNVVASVDVIWAIALKPMIEMIKKGERGGKIFTLNLANGGLKIVVNNEALVGKTTEDIVKGNIEVKVEK
jgi:basic membrane lipoprotein Med (substrate-binding protein (PBP1-ABC) superfamily)